MVAPAEPQSHFQSSNINIIPNFALPLSTEAISFHAKCTDSSLSFDSTSENPDPRTNPWSLIGQSQVAVTTLRIHLTVNADEQHLFLLPQHLHLICRSHLTLPSSPLVVLLVDSNGYPRLEEVS
jgi:hypothetical protein